MTAKGTPDVGHLPRRRDSRTQLVGATVCVLLALGTRELVAQQPLGQFAYTLGIPDLSGLHLRRADGTDQVLSPQIQVRVPASFGVPGNTVTASVASLATPVWSKDRRLLVANALLAPTSDKSLDSLLMNSLSTPSKLLVVFDPTTGQGNAVFDMTAGSQSPVSPYVINAAFAPDGNRLVYSYLQTNFVVYGIINRDGTGNVSLGWTNLTEEALGSGLDWSPRTDQLGNFGNQLVISIPVPVGTGDGSPTSAASLVLVNLGSSTPTRVLTRPPGPSGYFFYSFHDRSPVFSPDGTQIAFVRAVQDAGVVIGSEIMVINVNGPSGSERFIGYVPGMMIDHLSWSPFPGDSRIMFDMTQVSFGGLPSSNGIWTLTIPSVNGRAVMSQVSGLAQLADSPAWGPVE